MEKISPQLNMLSKIVQKFRFLYLRPITRNVLHQRLTYLSIDKLKRLEQAITETKHVPGDLVEFGVALGGSAIIIASEMPHGKRFHGFDVFAMIPPPVSVKDDKKSHERYEVISSGKSDGIGGDLYYGYKNDLFDEVKRSFTDNNLRVDGKRIFLHKGLFEDTWAKSGVTQVSLAHIDCDWYDPVSFCLNACADIISKDGIIVIDDYNDYGGCRAAVDEFLASRGDYRLELGSNPFIRKC